MYWIIQDYALVNAYHPFHLHGHDFHILAAGKGLFTPSTAELNRKNPPRRDTATLPGNGYLVIAFESDNPGYMPAPSWMSLARLADDTYRSWLMHCHIAWHASQSMALQFVEREVEIPRLIEPVMDDFRNRCARWDEYSSSAPYHQDGSGI